jgi:hypothetical protein
MSYSFNKDYSSLSGIDIRLDIYNLAFQKVLGSTNTISSSALYTGDLGGIYAVPNFLSAAPNISDTDFFIDFGDGTIVENNLSSFHTYQTTGNYPITLVVTTSSGQMFRGQESYVVDIKDPVPDKIILTQDNESQYESESTITFYVTRYNSLLTSQHLSSYDYNIKLSVRDNKSKIEFEKDYLNNPNFQYQNKGFFFTSPDDKFEVIDGVRTDSTLIYGKLVNNELVLSTLSAVDSRLVGTSGFGKFRYFEPAVDSLINTEVSQGDATASEDSSDGGGGGGGGGGIYYSFLPGETYLQAYHLD